MEPNSRGAQGQVLPLFALFLIVLMGFAALAIDVSSVLSARRYYRSVADGASLAGAQDMQVPGSRTITGTERTYARQHAMEAVVAQLGIPGGFAGLPANCRNTAADITDACVLTGTNYHVSVKADPTGIACQNCDPSRSVQVGLRNAAYPLTFARVLGQSNWNVGIT